ncbi:hypothetical protein [Bradyrhizobium elkanii]
MGLSTKGPITPYRGSWADLERRRREATLAMIEEDRVEAAITIAGIREQVRAFEGIDRVRGL